MVAAQRRADETDRIRRGLRMRDDERLRAGIPPGAPPERPSAVRVLDRSVAILSAVEDGVRSYIDIVERTGLPTTTTHRLIQGLEENGFLIHIGGLGYALGPRLLALATTAARDLPLRELAHPALERLARSTGESAQLYVRGGDRRVCIDAVESERELRTIVGIGASLPLDKGSAGKVFLAWGTEQDRAMLAADEGRLPQQIATARRRGWADSVAEREPGVASVSAPVFGPGRTLLAAVSVSGPASRLGQLRAKRYA
ncbi:MAG TPA: IclR family transcriptional regulator, partial [Actinomycetota bacterium]|nr:IclR family transcriptional regulator [Actinomycetota bacterium]